jgi:hypothetical protein
MKKHTSEFLMTKQFAVNPNNARQDFVGRIMKRRIKEEWRVPHGATLLRLSSKPRAASFKAQKQQTSKSLTYSISTKIWIRKFPLTSG